MECSPLGSSVHGSFQARFWNGLPFPPPWDLPDPGIKPESLRSPAFEADFLPMSNRGSPQKTHTMGLKKKLKKKNVKIQTVGFRTKF